MRPHLPVEYCRLANDSNSPSASMLFGDDLDGALKSMEQSAKFVKKMSDNKRYHNSDSFRGGGVVATSTTTTREADIEAVETTAIVVGAEEDPSITLMATPAILMERRRIFPKGTR